MNRRNLFWAEWRKLRRSNIVWIAIFAVCLTAGIVFVSGMEVYCGPEVHYGIKVMKSGMRYIENPGWYMDEVQPWALFFVLPGMVALFGSYLIGREKEEDTMKSLLLIPVEEEKLMRVKMIVTMFFAIGLAMFLFGITFLIEEILHASDLSGTLTVLLGKEYFLGGIGIFLAVFPVIAFTASRGKSCWSAFLFTELYSAAGLFAGMAGRIQDIYPITAVFNVSGYQITDTKSRGISALVLVLCGCLGIFFLKRDRISGKM